MIKYKSPFSLVEITHKLEFKNGYYQIFKDDTDLQALMKKSGYQMVTRVEASFNFIPTDEFSDKVYIMYNRMGMGVMGMGMLSYKQFTTGKI